MTLYQIILLYLFLLPLTSCSTSQKEEQVATIKAVPTGNNIQGLYFVSEDISSGGELGWVIYLDNKNSEGVIYDPPYGKLKLTNIKMTPTGGLTFNAVNNNDGKIQQSFAGTIYSDKISGTLSNSSNNSFKVKLEKITPDSVFYARNSDIGIIFSDVYYNDEGGDLLGDEVLMLHTSNGLKILLTCVEGEPSGPYFASNITEKGDTIFFSIPSRSNDSIFKIITKGKTAELYRHSNGFKTPTTLKQKGRITSKYQFILP